MSKENFKAAQDLAARAARNPDFDQRNRELVLIQLGAIAQQKSGDLTIEEASGIIIGMPLYGVQATALHEGKSDQNPIG